MGRRGAPPKAERNAQVVAMVESGVSLQLVGQRFGISRQRVDQIVQPLKQAVRSVLAEAVARGTVIRPDNCQTCGKAGKIEGHHPDYSKPLDVMWLCPKCHRAEHREAYRGPRTPRSERTCPVCKKQFTMRVSDPQRFCSKPCSRVGGRRVQRRISDGALLGALRELAAKLGRTPTIPDMIEQGRYSHTLYYRYFGSYREACRLAGLQAYGTGGAGHRNRRTFGTTKRGIAKAARIARLERQIAELQTMLAELRSEAA